MRSILLMSAISVLAVSASASTLDVTGPDMVNVGDTVTMTISYSGDTNLYGYEFDIDFPAFLEAESVTEEGYFATQGCCFSAGMIDNTADTISLIFDSLSGDDPGTSSTNLVSIEFLAAGTGTGSIQIPNNGDLVLADPNGNTITVDTLGSASIQAAVPEPSITLLVGVGLLLLLVCRKWSRFRAVVCAGHN